MIALGPLGKLLGDIIDEITKAHPVNLNLAPNIKIPTPDIKLPEIKLPEIKLPDVHIDIPNPIQGAASGVQSAAEQLPSMQNNPEATQTAPPGGQNPFEKGGSFNP